MTTIVRETRETRVEVEFGVGATTIATTIPFLDHMLATFARYANLTIRVSARGDLAHHISEDIAIAIGTALVDYAPSQAARFGDRTVPMDDALVHCALDLGGRPYYKGPLPSARY